MWFKNYLSALGCILIAALGWQLLVIAVALILSKLLPVSAWDSRYPWMAIVVGCSLGTPFVYVCNRIFKHFNV